MPEGISQEQFDKLKEELEKMKKELEKQKEELKKQTDNRTLKQQVVRKLAAIFEIQGLAEMNDLPSPERLRELNEMLQENISWFQQFLEAALAILKTIIEGIIKALKTLWEFLKSFFPNEETQTAMVGDRVPEAGEYVCFATVGGLGENRGRVSFPVGFAGLKEGLAVDINPATVRMDVLLAGGSGNLQCIEIASFAAVSHPIHILNKTIPSMVQTLDPRISSGGTYNPETGEVRGRLYTRSFDGHMFTPLSPIVISGRFEGRVKGDRQPVIEIRTESIDFLSDTPFRKLFCLA
jgi:hypothetical protein